MKPRLAMMCVLTLSVMLFGSFAFAQEPPPPQAQEPQVMQMITGLDGKEYQPYKTSVIEAVQTALQGAGVYSGTVNGVLDETTMQAIGEFQKQHGIHVSGVPSPKTREALGL
jgi:peptidoglycan hydrolase-like protein with peptidoglycan-binding domain